MLQYGRGISRQKGFSTVSNFRKKYLTNIWNLPNILTIVRIILIPVFVVFFVLKQDKIALLIFLLASATDWLDGYLARKNNQITDFGKLMDPLADKLMVCTALICQGVRGAIPWFAILIVVAKESFMLFGATYMLNKGVVVYSNILGKAAQVSFIAALVLSFWHEELAAAPLAWDSIFLTIAVILALAALTDYTAASLKQLREMKQ